MYWTDDLNSGKWHNVEENGYNTIFNYDNWEPGYTDVKYIKLVNAGDLALNYKLALTPQNGVGKLAEVINVYFAEGGVAVEQRSDLQNLQAIGLLKSVLNGGSTADGTLLAADQYSPLHPSGEVIMTLAMNMLTTAGNEYQNEDAGTFSITALATQASFEKDSFGSNYDANATFPTILTSGSASADVTPADGKVPAGGVTLSGGNISAFVPEGVALNDGVNELTLTVTPLKNTTSNITTVNNEILIPVDVHIDGVAEDNTVPIVIDLGEILPKYLNMGNYRLFHVEDGTNNEMTLVDDKTNLSAHNQFTYNSDTGEVSVAMASFSEVALVADTGNPWSGDYSNIDTDFNGEGTQAKPYIISSADELAGLSVLISADDDDEDTTNNWGNKYYKLISNINIDKNIWYPIGYRKIGNGTNSAGETWYTYGGALTGTFDGTGHTINGIRANTWAMDGNYDAGYYKAAMGLFGFVNGGTVKNLTINDFESDGEFTPTGCVTAYAAGNATFENIAIIDCNPRTYNTGVAGIVGWDDGGDSEAEASNFTFKNITVDNNTTISALWGSWDVAAAGVLGYLGEYSKANFENCQLAPTIDVYNDVCGNYQYYWYRYCGMVIGTVDKRLDNGKGALDLSNVTAENCTVDFGDRHEYYYCEFIENSIASYTHDYQMSRVPNSELDFNANPVICTHIHSDKTEVIDGTSVLVEDKRAVYIPFRQLFGGYGWGVDGVDEWENIDIRDITGLEEKFAVLDDLAEKDFLFRVGNGNAFPISKLFKAKDGAHINDTGVYVSVTSMVDGVEIIGTFELNEDNWAESTLKISGIGPAKITIQDYSMCTPTELLVEVVDGNNVTAYSELKNANSVLLNDITMTSNGKYSLYDNKTLYGNGFTFDVTNGMDSDTEGGYIGGNGTVFVRNSTLDNVKIVGEVYTVYGGTAKSEYNFPTVLVLGDSVIANSYISNGCSPVRVSSGCNIEIINSTLEGGIFANLDIRGGTVKLQDVTTINQSTTAGQSISNDKGVVGLGIVVYTGSTVTIDADGLTQYNCISKNTTFKAQDANTLKTVIFGNNYKNYQFNYDGATWVNTGILSMVAEVKDENISNIAGYVGQDASISSYNGYVYAPQGLTSVASPANYSSSAQYQIAPKYSFDYTSKNNVPQESGSNDYCYYDESTQKYLISFDDGETFTWDADILSITKGEATIVPSISVSGDAIVNSDNTITFDTAGDYTVTYKYTDNDNYRLNSDGKFEKYSANYEKTVKITVYEVVDTSAKTEFAFGTNGFRTETANNLTYVMPDVNSTSAHPKTSTGTGIGVTTVDGVAIYYPIISMQKSGSASWYNYFSVFDAVTITDLNGTVHNTSSTELPSGLTVVGGFILDANGNVSTAESANGTAIFNYSTGKEIKCATYSSHGLCYYPDSQFTKTGTSSRAEQTIVAKYRYTDSNGTSYYYYVGYWCEEHTKQECVTPDTLITLADGSQKRVDSLTGKEMLLVWNLETGRYEKAPIVFVDSEKQAEYEIVHLYFSDNSDVKVIGEHGFFDLNLGKYVYIDAKNYADYVGHEFVKEGNISKDTWDIITLDRVVVEKEVTTAWSPVTFDHLCYYTNGVLSMPGGIDGLFNIFEVDTDTMTYDAEQMKKDIETYGLFTYEDFCGLIPEIAFEAFNGDYLKVAIGKGLLTWEDIAYLAERYMPLM